MPEAREYRLDVAASGWSIAHPQMRDRERALSTAQTAANKTGSVVKVWCRPIGGRDIDWSLLAERSPVA
jgi:hypothetical protein